MELTELAKRGESPIPGFKTVKQVEENVKALEYGPLKPSQMKAIDEILGPRNLVYE